LKVKIFFRNYLVSIFFGFLVLSICNANDLFGQDLVPGQDESLLQNSDIRSFNIYEIPVRESVQRESVDGGTPKIKYTLPSSIGPVPDVVPPMPMPRNVTSDPVSNLEEAVKKVSKTTDSGKKNIEYRNETETGNPDFDQLPISYSENTCHFNGSDTRELISPTNYFPFSAVVKLRMRYGGSWFGCSGIVIAPSWVLTAGHCIYDTDTDDWADEVIVIPALDGTTEPYGQTYKMSLHSFNGWVISHSYDWDMGWIELASPIGDTVGTIPMKVYSDSTLLGGILNTAGYPYDYNNATWMAYDAREIQIVSSQLICSELSTCSGQSGSGAWFHFVSGNRFVTGIHSGYGDITCLGYTRQTRISQGKYDAICSDVPCTCECASGLCCDGCNYKSSSEICNSVLNSEYRCEGSSCGSVAQKRTQVQYCSGSSDNCDGSTEWLSWNNVATCTTDQLCQTDRTSYANCSICTYGCKNGQCCQCSTGECCDGCKYKSNSVICNNEVSVEYQCDGTSCGSNAQKRIQVRNCTGSSALCDGSSQWQSWETQSDCAENQICETDEVTFSKCTTCAYKCENNQCINPSGGCAVVEL